MIFRAVLFDLDGTLLNTLNSLADATNTALSLRGFPVHDTESYKQMVGRGVRKLAEAALPTDERSASMIEALTDEISRTLGGPHATAIVPYPGIPEMLSGLEQRKVRYGVVSNKPDELVRKAIADTLGSFRFGVVRGARPGVPTKPEPAGALLALRDLQVEPQEALFLGDSDIDMQTATAANIMALGAAWGFRSTKELRESGAHAVLASPLELLAWFEE